MMGWGNEPHEGFEVLQRDTGEWTRGTWSYSSFGDPIAQRAACSCGWRGDMIHPVPVAPDLDTPSWSAYERECDRIDEQIYTEWRGSHLSPLLDHDPSWLLILGHDDAGPRHFLNGRPVHAGARLELLLGDGRWQPISYEWNWKNAEAPTATIRLGCPCTAEQLGEPLTASLLLPADALLRWPPT